MSHRVILVMIEPPLPFGHASARWFNVLLRGLVARGHRVTAFATCSRPDDVARAAALFPRPTFDLRCYPHQTPGRLRSRLRSAIRPFSYMFSDDLRRDLDRTLAAGFDVLHLEQLWSGWLGLGHVDRSITNVHHLYAIDLEGVPTGRGLRSRYVRLRQLSTERRLLAAYRHYLTVSPRLTDHVREVNPTATVTTTPIALDLSLYQPVSQAPGGAPVISLIGNMGWSPSRSAAERLIERLWPAIRRRVPAARLEVVGWGARAALSAYLDRPGVEVHENVPDVRPFVERATVCVYAPARGSGMKVKVLEALAQGLPVVTNSEGAEGLPAQDGVHMALANDDAGLIERTVELLSNPDARGELARGGRELVEQACAPDRALDLVEAAHATLIDEARR